jgi:uncharacterized protein HemX
MEDASPATPTAPEVRTRGGKPLLLLVLLVIAASLSWWAWQRWLAATSPSAPPATPPAAPPAAPPDTAAAADALREQVGDLVRVNNVLRQQVLALTERVRVLGDQVTTLQQQPRGDANADASAHTPELALAEQWLELAQARFDLFDDVRGALTALEGADRVLSRADDPRVRSLRQTLGIEREALRATPQADSLAVSGQLQAWQQASAGWPLRSDATAPGTPDDGSLIGGWLARLDRYFTVRRLEPGTTPMRLTDGRALVAAELAWARLLLVRGESAELRSTLARIADTLTEVFDGNDEGVATALEGMRALSDRVLGGATATRLGATLAELQGLVRARREPVVENRPAEAVMPVPAAEGEQPAPPPAESPDTPEQAVEPATAESIPPGGSLS